MAVIFVTSKAANCSKLITVLSVRFVFFGCGVCTRSYMFWDVYAAFYGVPFLQGVNFVTSFARCPYFPELWNSHDSFFICFSVYSNYSHRNSLFYCMEF